MGTHPAKLWATPAAATTTNWWTTGQDYPEEEGSPHHPKPGTSCPCHQTNWPDTAVYAGDRRLRSVLRDTWLLPPWHLSRPRSSPKPAPGKSCSTFQTFLVRTFQLSKTAPSTTGNHLNTNLSYPSSNRNLCRTTPRTTSPGTSPLTSKEFCRSSSDSPEPTTPRSHQPGSKQNTQW